jgi:hypothetical protein
MAANGISTMATKELRQIAKLDLAALKRATTNRRSTYDIELLPAPYTGNVAVPANGAATLTEGRPWTSTP